MAVNNQKSDGRGGKREGAGRKKGYSPGREALSVRQVQEMREKMKARAQVTGKDENDILIDWIQATDVEGKSIEIGIRDRIACLKLWKEYTSPKITEGGEADMSVGPAVFLPDQHPRLELVDVGSSKTTDD